MSVAVAGDQYTVAVAELALVLTLYDDGHVMFGGVRSATTTTNEHVA